MKLDLSKLSSEVGGKLHLPDGMTGNEMIDGIASLEEATPSQITFLGSDHFLAIAPESKAGCIVTKEIIEGYSGGQIIHPEPYQAIAQIAHFYWDRSHSQQGQSPKAHIEDGAKVEESVILFPGSYVSEGAVLEEGVVLYPGVFIGRNAVVGQNTVIYSNCFIGPRSKVGKDCILHANSTLGSDGFGFVPHEGRLAKVPQLGHVELGDRVEIGSNCSLDCGTFGATKIGDDTKLDNQVHVGHNVVIGKNTVICGGVCLAGSCKIGDWCALGGMAAVSNKIIIGDQVQVGAKSGVTKNLPDPGVYMGFPAVPASQWRREIGAVRRIKDLIARVGRLEKRS